MPDPVLYAEAVIAAAGASALFVLAFGWVRRPPTAIWVNLACVAGVGLGLVLGCLVLRIRPAWPPANGLDRFLSMILPAAAVIELIGGMPDVPRRLAWLLRMGLAGVSGRILLHRSSYLVGAWTAIQAALVLGSCAIVLALVWNLLVRLSNRAPGVSILLAIAQASLCGGMAIMMAGYLTGGEATLPLSGALVGAGGASFLLITRPALPGAIGIGVVGLFCLLFIGRFFGELSTGRALLVFLAPLLCWASELPMSRGRRPWLIATARLALVAIPLIVVLILAKQDLDRKLANPRAVASAQVDSCRSRK